MEIDNMVHELKILAKLDVTFRGDIVEFFRQLYKRCMEDRTFYALFLNNPRKAILTELERDSWMAVPMEQFEPMFKAAMPEMGIGRTDSVLIPFDPVQIFKLAEKISTDKSFAEAFRKDPVGIMDRMMGSLKVRAHIKIKVTHSSNCDTEVVIEIEVAW